MFIDFTLFIFTLIVLNDVFNDKLQSEQILNTEIKQISLLLSFLHLKSFVFRFHDKTLSPLITFHIYISQPKIPRAQVLSLFLIYVVATPHPGVRFYRSFSYAGETRVEHFHRDRVCRVVELMHGSFTIVDKFSYRAHALRQFVCIWRPLRKRFSRASEFPATGYPMRYSRPAHHPRPEPRPEPLTLPYS